MKPAGRRSVPRGVLAILVLAFGIRIGYALVIKAGPCQLRADGVVLGTYHSECTGANDQINYNSTANTLASGGGFRSTETPSRPLAEHPPMTTVVLGAVSFAFDHLPLSLIADETELPFQSALRTHVREHRVFMALLGTFNVGLIMLFAGRVSGSRVRIVAGFIAAIYPFLWVNDGLVMSETIAITFVVATLIAVEAELRRTSTRTRVAIGLLCGGAALTRAELVGLAPVLALVVAWPRGDAPRRWAKATAATATIGFATAAVLAPWVVFNAQRFDRPVAISTNDGLTLAGSNCDRSYYGSDIGLWLPDPPCLFSNDELAARGPVDASVIASEYRTRAFAYMSDHRSQIPAVVAARVARLWNLYRPFDMVRYNIGEGRETWVTRAGLLSYFALFPFAVAGVVLLWRRSRRRLTIALCAPAIVVTASATLLVGQTRMRVPAEPSFVVLAAIGIVAGADAIARRRESPRSS